MSAQVEAVNGVSGTRGEFPWGNDRSDLAQASEWKSKGKFTQVSPKLRHALNALGSRGFVQGFREDLCRGTQRAV